MARRTEMEYRRQFIKKMLGFMAGAGVLFSPLSLFVRRVYGNAKRILLPRGTKMDSLIQKDPKSFDTRNLGVTPLKDFETMGITDYEVDLAKWRLLVEGAVQEPLRLTYEEVKSIPSMERKVLLICPGFFAYHGRWKGLAVERLLERAGMDEKATYVTLAGPEGEHEMVESYSINEIRTGKIFLAYEVNGRPLPRKHGFPLRVVAEDRYGLEWVKYVYKVTVEKKNATSRKAKS
jgi:sulfoxide reductase catalytic subunit YedY